MKVKLDFSPGTLLRSALLPILCTSLSVCARANPQGGSVAQGSATFNSSGSTLTVHTSDRAFINWQSFNIGLGETTRFVQPSASSLVWNHINDVNPSQILGNLSANGYVVLQNQAGFYVGGQASITTHGLMMTTAPIPMPDLFSGGPWQFNLIPPTASIINYGQISAENGGSVFLIANSVENHGTISAPGGKIGLYAGKEVLVSERPDGRGLSAHVTLPEGSVSNDGHLIADAGTIAMHAKVVNQGGLVQANSVRKINGVIELVASENLKLTGSSTLSAHGDSTDVSPGGNVVLRSEGKFEDSAASRIELAGGTQGGASGLLEVFGVGASVDTIQSRINDSSGVNYASSGLFFVNPQDITLSLNPTSAAQANLNINDLANYARIDVHALNDIVLSAPWVLRDPGAPASLSLSAGNNLILNDGTSIRTQDNWDINASAGFNSAASAETINGLRRFHGIYLDGNAALQTATGDIDAWAANELIVNPGAEYPIGTGSVGNNGIRTTKGGSIQVVASTGDVNTGGNFNGFIFGQNDAPYYRVSNNNLGGISTGAGGDVTIIAGKNVTSFNPQQAAPGDINKAANDAGTGAFGKGNVRITAGGNVSGHYVLADGTGSISAGGQIGVPPIGAQSGGFSLSLIKGAWNIYAPNGSIYVQDVRNPNGIFNDKNVSGYLGYHHFDYDPSSSVFFQARDTVELTGGGVPHTPPSANATPIPLIFPPSLKVVSGAGGFRLDKSVILFPSSEGELNIGTSGDFVGVPDLSGIYPTLAMSDSGAAQWLGPESFGLKEHAATPPELDNPNPVEITIGGSLKTLNLYTTKATHIEVAEDLINSSFVGENLHPDDVTSIQVQGSIFNTPSYVFATLDTPIVSADSLNSAAWDSIFLLAVDPSLAASIPVAPNATANELRQDVARMRLFETNPGFVFNSTTLRLGFRNPMPESVRTVLESPVTVLRYGPDGLPLVRNGHYVTAQASFVPAQVIESLYQQSLSIPRESPLGYQIGGPGEFRIEAGSMNLGSTLGVLSWGIGGPPGDNRRYSALAGTIDSGAAINLILKGDLDMFTSTIATFYGGDVNVTSTEGELNLGSQELFGQSRFAFGIYTSGHSDVHVTAAKDINIEGSRIAAYNGGDVFVKSLDGNVNVGSGGNTYVNVQLVSLNADNQAVTREDPIYGSGIVAVSLPGDLRGPADSALPGDITVEAPHGDITASRAGILQIALDGNVAGGPTVTLVAGTPAQDGQPAIPGNIDLGDSGLIGGTVNVSAEGNIRGLIVSRQNSTVNAAQNFSGTVLAAGTANLAAGGSVSGSVIGIGGVNASSGGLNSANLLGQNVSVNGGASQSTLGTTAAATAASQSAAQQSTTQAKEQVAANNALNDDDDKKKREKRPTLTRRSRVTVILPKG